MFCFIMTKPVQISLNKEAVNPMKAKRIRPDEDAKFWCQAGLDKDGFEKDSLITL